MQCIVGQDIFVCNFFSLFHKILCYFIPSCFTIFKAKCKKTVKNKKQKDKVQQKIYNISYADYLNKDIKVMDATAISLAKDSSLPIIIFSIMKSSNILDIIEGKGKYSIIK